MSILSVKNLEKKFGDLTVLKDISFDINDGEIISTPYLERKSEKKIYIL